ncbi:THO complex subunit 1-like isoform X1 [Daphnia pulex]|uniref:THO complex subunit 1-like isoform X1 n=1 Tax=Daphnia pulex TaxID=6669 RepID=UPI001EE0C252|nr:THO complex subunit 1-like isoform X1 [Daphnia pulex]XP_046645312.1 THO complex subunit 1-like isoform X1 [Daphnia pulicaria]
MEIFDFEKTRCSFLDSISEALKLGGPPTISELLSVNNTAHLGEADKKAVWDQAFRDRFLSDSSNFSIPLFEKLLQLSLDCAVALVCSPTLPVILLTDAFDILSLEKCEEIFYMVEMKVAIWKQELFFNQCKNTLLRLCNDLLRRLSRSQNTVFCGRILLFLAKFFPFSERSGLNVVSEFNLDNLTTFGAKDESYAADISANSEKHKDAMEVEESLSSDYNLYKKFWSLQDFFRNPNQCYTKIPWKTFCLHTSDVLSAFSTIKLDERRNRSKWDEADVALNIDMNETSMNGGNVQQYFAKYLTSQNLLELQLGDSNFRRYILLQFLIMFQYLDSPVKFKHETHKLNEEQTTWVSEAIDQVYRLLKDTPPDGASFVQSIRHILKREELWSNWKNDGCPEFRPSITSSTTDNDTIKDGTNGEKKTIVVGRPRRLKRSLGDQIREASKRNKCIIGNAEMNRLWNLCPDNMAACRSKDRDFLPTLENYFEEAIEQLDPSVESQYKRVSEANFGWRALRLLARRSLHFFTHGNTPITRLPDYLETHVRKLAKDMQQSANALPNVKPEPVDDAGEVEQMEPEADPVSNNSEIEGVPEETNVKPDEMEEEESTEKKPVLCCTMDQLTRLAKQIGTNWKLLAPKLGFGPDEVEYFESETNEVEIQAKKMFQIWLENEADATPENLLYTLEGLGMLDSAQGIL